MEPFLRSLAFAIMPRPLPPLHLQTFRIVKTFSDDDHNKIPKGGVFCNVETLDGKPVGDFNYRSHNGQVGGMYLTEEYRHRTLEQQMLIYMMKDMQDAGAKEIWEVVNREMDKDKRYYSILWAFRFKPSHIHSSVTGPGYVMRIPEDLRSLIIIPGVGLYKEEP